MYKHILVSVINNQLQLSKTYINHSFFLLNAFNFGLALRVHFHNALFLNLQDFSAFFNTLKAGLNFEHRRKDASRKALNDHIAIFWKNVQSKLKTPSV